MQNQGHSSVAMLVTQIRSLQHRTSENVLFNCKAYKFHLCFLAVTSVLYCALLKSGSYYSQLLTPHPTLSRPLFFFFFHPSLPEHKKIYSYREQRQLGIGE